MNAPRHDCPTRRELKPNWPPDTTLAIIEGKHAKLFHQLTRLFGRREAGDMILNMVFDRFKRGLR